MGRTLPTFNTFLQMEERSWADFRRALRSAEERAAVDRLFSRVRRHSAECGCATRAVPFDAVLMAILMEHEMEIEALRRRAAEE